MFESTRLHSGPADQYSVSYTCIGYVDVLNGEDSVCRHLPGGPSVGWLDPPGFFYGALREVIALLYFPEVLPIGGVERQRDAQDKDGKYSFSDRCYEPDNGVLLLDLSVSLNTE